MKPRRARWEFDEIVEQVYRAAVGEVSWDHPLAAIAQKTGSNYAFYQAQKLPTLDTVRFLYDDAPVDGMGDYLEHWVEEDPRLAFALRSPGLDLYNDHIIGAGDSKLFDRPFYTEFLSALDLKYFACAMITPPTDGTNGRQIACLGINRRARAGHASEEDCDLLLALRPHVERALSIETRLNLAEAKIEVLSDTLNALAYGVILVDRSSTIRWANETARQTLDRRDGIVAEKGVLAATSRRARAQLREAVAGACLAILDPSRRPGGSILVPREGGPPIEVLVAPLPDNSPLLAGLIDRQRNCAVCIVQEQGLPKPSIESALVSLYGLTPAESRLAVELSTGATLKDAADARRITYETARTLIKRIYSKTDTHTQAQLVRLVLSSPAARFLS